MTHIRHCANKCNSWSERFFPQSVRWSECFSKPTTDGAKHATWTSPCQTTFQWISCVARNVLIWRKLSKRHTIKSRMYIWITHVRYMYDMCLWFCFAMYHWTHFLRFTRGDIDEFVGFEDFLLLAKEHVCNNNVIWICNQWSSRVRICTSGFWIIWK